MHFELFIESNSLPDQGHSVQNKQQLSKTPTLPESGVQFVDCLGECWKCMALDLSFMCMNKKYFPQEMFSLSTFTVILNAATALSSVYPRHGDCSWKGCGRPTEGPEHNAPAQRVNAEVTKMIILFWTVFL